MPCAHGHRRRGLQGPRGQRASTGAALVAGDERCPGRAAYRDAQRRVAPVVGGTPPGPATCHCCGVAHGFCAPTVFLLSIGVSSAACIVVRSRRRLSVLVWRDWRHSHRVGGAGERTARPTGSMAPKRTFLEPHPAWVRPYPMDSVCYYCQRQTGHVMERVAGSAAR